MPLFLFFLFFSSFIYANTVKINSTFSEQHNICIYNATNDKLTIYLKSKNKSSNKVCLTFKDYSGVLTSKCDTQKVTIKPDSLRNNTIYYLTDLGYSQDDNYFLKIEGDNDGIIASECPSIALAKVANASSTGIANALVLAGVLAGFLFFAGVIWAFIPFSREEKDNFYD